MRETRTYGSARGAAGNSRPYRKPGSRAASPTKAGAAGSPQTADLPRTVSRRFRVNSGHRRFRA
jgi:hypothetical protein